MRMGIGYDVHRLVEGRRLIIGGVHIPWPRGLMGHSDADVLIHAVCDAILGAAALGDIGKHFPPSDPQFKDADSSHLLRRVASMVAEKGYTVENIDSVVIAEEPHLQKYMDDMRRNIAAAASLDVSRVSVKATTTEGLGFTGRGEGIAAMAICTLRKDRRMSEKVFDV